MKFLVTGSAGFIGFHVARRLLDDGHSVVGFDGLTPYYDVALKKRRHAMLEQSAGFTPIVGQLADTGALARAGELARPDVIVHLAAQAGVRHSFENPGAYIESNVTGSWNVLALATRLQPGHLLLASTSSVYGASDLVPFAESDPADHPLSIYAATKKAMEAMGHAHAHLHAIPTTVFRLFTVYGPWGRPDMALFKFTSAILANRPIEVYGQGRMERDLTYIDDLVEAVIRLIDKPPTPGKPVSTPGAQDTLSPAAPYRIVNIGSGRPVDLPALIAELENALGVQAVRKLLPLQTGDMRATHASPALLEALTGFRPKTSLTDGVRAFVEWYRETYPV